MSAGPRGLAAQGAIPHHRHAFGRRDDCSADSMVSAGPRRLSRGAGAMGRDLRFRRHPVPQLRLLCRGTSRLHRGDYRGRHPRSHGRPEQRDLHAGGHPRQRGLDRHPVRRPRARRDGFRRCPPAACGHVRCRIGRRRRAIQVHPGSGRIRVARRSAAGSTRARSTGHRARSADGPSDRRVRKAIPSLARTAGRYRRAVCRACRLARCCIAARPDSG